MYNEAINLCGWPMSECLLYDENKFDRNVKLEDFQKTPDDIDIGYVIEVDSKYPDNIKEKTTFFPFAPENEKIILMISVII